MRLKRYVRATLLRAGGRRFRTNLYRFPRRALQVRRLHRRAYRLRRRKLKRRRVRRLRVVYSWGMYSRRQQRGIRVNRQKRRQYLIYLRQR